MVNPKVMPASFSIVRRCSLLSCPRKLLLFCAYSSTASETFLSCLQRYDGDTHVEKKLDTVKAKLDSQCVSQVLEKCASNRPQTGLRFFIWAALHPSHRHSTYTYTLACKSLGVEQNPRIIMDVMDNYRDEGFAVSIRMFKVILNLCRAAKDDNLGLWVLRKMREFNCRPDTISYNVVIRLLVEKGRLDEAMGLIKEMGLIDLYPDIITYVSIMKGFCDVGRLEDSFGLIKAMKAHGCVPNSVVYSVLLDGISGHGNLEVALEFLDGIEKGSEECKPNVVTYTTLIKGFVEKGRALEAVTILNRMADFGLKPNRVTFVSLLDGLCREDRVDEAHKVVDKFSVGEFPYNVLYSLLVVSILRSGKHKESESTLKTMLGRGLRPTGLASSSIIKHMISEGRVLAAFSLFDALDKSGNLVHIDTDVYSTLLVRLCEENRLMEAAKVVGTMTEGRIRLKPGHAEKIVQHLNGTGQYDLASKVLRING